MAQTLTLGGVPQINVLMQRGDHATLKITLKAGSPSLEGYTAKLQARADPDDTTVVFERTTEDGTIVIDSDAGAIFVLWAREETSQYTFTTVGYDLELVSPDGKVTTVVRGDIALSRDYTR